MKHQYPRLNQACVNLWDLPSYLSCNISASPCPILKSFWSNVQYYLFWICSAVVKTASFYLHSFRNRSKNKMIGQKAVLQQPLFPCEKLQIWTKNKYRRPCRLESLMWKQFSAWFACGCCVNSFILFVFDCHQYEISLFCIQKFSCAILSPLSFI